LRGYSTYGGDLFDLRVSPSLMWGRSRTRLAWIRGCGSRSRGCPPAGPPGPGLGFGERYPPESAGQTPRTSSPRVECGRGTRPPAGQIDRTYISTEQAGAGRVSLRPPVSRRHILSKCPPHPSTRGETSRPPILPAPQTLPPLGQPPIHGFRLRDCRRSRRACAWGRGGADLWGEAQQPRNHHPGRTARRPSSHECGNWRQTQPTLHPMTEFA